MPRKRQLEQTRPSDDALLASLVWKKKEVAEWLGVGLEYVDYLMLHEGLPYFRPRKDGRLTLFSEYRVKEWFHNRS